MTIDKSLCLCGFLMATALMQQLKTLLNQVEKIRSRLQQVDQVVIKVSLFIYFWKKTREVLIFFIN